MKFLGDGVVFIAMAQQFGQTQLQRLVALAQDLNLAFDQRDGFGAGVMRERQAAEQLGMILKEAGPLT